MMRKLLTRRRNFLVTFLAVVVLATAMPSFSQDHQDAAEIDRLSRAWIEAWSPKADAKNFDFMERFSDFYAPGDDLILFDNADPEARIAKSAQEYGRIWNSLLPQLAYVDNRIIQEPTVFVEGDLAVSTFVWETTFISDDGTEQRIPTLGTLVWQRTPQGWRIVHEHGTALSDESGGAGNKNKFKHVIGSSSH